MRSSAYWPSINSVKEGTLSCNWEMRFEWDEGGDWTWDAEHGLQGDSPPTDEADPNTVLERLQTATGELVRCICLPCDKATHHCPCLSYDHWEVKLADNFVLSLVPQRLMQSWKRAARFACKRIYSHWPNLGNVHANTGSDKADNVDYVWEPNNWLYIRNAICYFVSVFSCKYTDFLQPCYTLRINNSS